MKRLLLHIIFWFVYFVQSVLLTFLVNTTRIPLTTSDNIALSSLHVLMLLIPKILFTYFILSIALERLIREGFGKTWSLYTVIALLLSIVLYRALISYVIYPNIYHRQDHSTTFFYALGFPVALMDIGFVSGVAIALKQIRQQLVRAKNEQSLIHEKLTAELKYLRHQTNPHFLFNTLNNIYALARKKSDDAPDAILKLSRLLRFMLDDAARPFITIGEEISFLEHYIELEKMRYNGKVTLSFSQDVVNRQERIAPLLLLPFVENAFKHGVGESRFASFIQVDMRLKDDVLTFSVKNSKEHPPHESSGIGLSNVRRQLELLYPEYQLDVTNEPTVYIVILTINLKRHANHHLPHH